MMGSHAEDSAIIPGTTTEAIYSEYFFCVIFHFEEGQGKMRRRAAETRNRKDQIGASSTKYIVPGDPLEGEARMMSMVPQSVDETDRMLEVANTMLKQENLTPGERNALEAWKMQLSAKGIKGQVQHEFVRDFWQWLIGRGKDSDHARTPWARQSVAYDEEVSTYLDLMYSKMHHYNMKLKLLSTRVPEGINQFFIYFKYVVRGELLDKSNFLHDFQLFTDEFKAAREVGQWHRDPAAGPHEVAPYGDMKDVDQQARLYGSRAVVGTKFDMDMSDDEDNRVDEQAEYEKAVAEGRGWEWQAAKWKEQDDLRQEAYREMEAEADAAEKAELKEIQESEKEVNKILKEIEKYDKENVMAMDVEDERAKLDEIAQQVAEKEFEEDEKQLEKEREAMDTSEDTLTPEALAKVQEAQKKADEMDAKAAEKEFEENKMDTDEGMLSEEEKKQLTEKQEAEDKLEAEKQKAKEKLEAEKQKAKEEKEKAKAEKAAAKAKAREEKVAAIAKEREKLVAQRDAANERLKAAKEAANSKMEKKLAKMKEKENAPASIESKLKKLRAAKSEAAEMKQAAEAKRELLQESRSAGVAAQQPTDDIDFELMEVDKLLREAAKLEADAEAHEQVLTERKEIEKITRKQNVEDLSAVLKQQKEGQAESVDVQQKLLVAIIDLTTHVKQLEKNLAGGVGTAKENLDQLKETRKTAEKIAPDARSVAANDTSAENLGAVTELEDLSTTAFVAEISNSEKKMDKFIKKPTSTEPTSKKRKGVAEKIAETNAATTVAEAQTKAAEQVGFVFQDVPISDAFEFKAMVEEAKADAANTAVEMKMEEIPDSEMKDAIAATKRAREVAQAEVSDVAEKISKVAKDISIVEQAMKKVDQTDDEKSKAILKHLKTKKKDLSRMKSSLNKTRIAAKARQTEASKIIKAHEKQVKAALAAEIAAEKARLAEEKALAEVAAKAEAEKLLADTQTQAMVEEEDVDILTVDSNEESFLEKLRREKAEEADVDILAEDPEEESVVEKLRKEKAEADKKRELDDKGKEEEEEFAPAKKKKETAPAPEEEKEEEKPEAKEEEGPPPLELIEEESGEKKRVRIARRRGGGRKKEKRGKTGIGG